MEFQKLDPPPLHLRYKNEPRIDPDGRTIEQRMGKRWNAFSPQTRIEMMSSGGIHMVGVRRGGEIDPTSNWGRIGCAQRTLVTNLCSGHFE